MQFFSSKTRPAPSALTSVVLNGLATEVPQFVAELLNQQQRAIDHLANRLEWHVRNDDVNLGQQGNEFWEGGYHRGVRALAIIKQGLFTKVRLGGQELGVAQGNSQEILQVNGVAVKAPSIAVQLLSDNEQAIRRLSNRLHWYVKNDEVNLNEEENEYWICGFYRAKYALRYVATRRFTPYHVDGITPAPVKPEFSRRIYDTPFVEAYLGEPGHSSAS